MKVKIKQKIIILFLIITISALHYFTGSSDSPVHNFYRLLFFIPIILAAFNFGFKGGVTASLVVSLIYSPFMLLSIGSFGWRALNELLDVVLFFAVGVITGILIEKKNISLEKLDNELNRYVLLESYTNGIIESIKSGVIAVNNDLLITMINQGAKELLGIAEECVGQNFTDVFSCCESVSNKILDSINKGIINENIEVTRNKEGRELIIRISIFPLKLEGSKKGLVITLDDITEMKKLHRQLQINDKLAALGELSTGIAHEIRNPLGIIKAIEQTMKNELRSDPEAVKELEIIDEEVERANRVVKSLMEFGKPGKNKKTFCSVNVVLEDVLAITRKYALQHKVDASFEKYDVPDSYIDKDQLKQAFVNLIFNAVQAMPSGGKLRVVTKPEGEAAVKIVFEDTGTGIPEDSLERVFNPFYTTREEGTGLGLSIVHRIIEEHGGNINIYSKVGEGTRVEIVLPLRKDLLNEKNIDRR